MTFMRAAAAEIALRLERRFVGQNRTGRPTCGTFHQIAASLLREFAYETGSSPDVRAIDDARARGIFSNAFRDLLAGRLGVDRSPRSRCSTGKLSLNSISPALRCA